MKNILIPRPHAMEWLERWRDKEPIKVITGLRRCGKSSALALFRDQLHKSGVPAQNILSINFESLDEIYPTESQALYDYVVERLSSGMNYIFLDEVQHVRDFERAVDSLALRDDVDIYITGSNADMLSGELATLITGRYVEFQMYPFSFAEYRMAFTEMNKEALFDRYITYGGMPYTVNLTDDQSIADYLGGVFNTIVMGDVARRHPRMNMQAFQRTASFLADNVGNITSLNRISSGLKRSGAAVSVGSVNEYVGALMENYLLNKAPRFNIKGREYLETLEKYYLNDLGFRFWLLGKRQGDMGHRIENVVYVELLRRFTYVSVGKMGQAEIDFVAVKDGVPTYIQVAQSLISDEVRERKYAPLRAIMDNHAKLVLTLDHIGNGDHDGIKQVNLIDWLLEQ
ncbi:ATP-binding protein [Adlercreutzia sp. ZJ154]|uniref:ATP-binding protein n=1 Tax=Adlercreutzia sp. ZJ154 TaxID=2709790 RepID=UPI0013EC78AC|nr:ATP-binding protein [Adlercreutzia sp. ZJ154]